MIMIMIMMIPCSMPSNDNGGSCGLSALLTQLLPNTNIIITNTFTITTSITITITITITINNTNSNTKQRFKV